MNPCSCLVALNNGTLQDHVGLGCLAECLRNPCSDLVALNNGMLQGYVGLGCLVEWLKQNILAPILWH